jgi:hypothetical protein
MLASDMARHRASRSAENNDKLLSNQPSRNADEQRKAAYSCLCMHEPAGVFGGFSAMTPLKILYAFMIATFALRFCGLNYAPLTGDCLLFYALCLAAFTVAYLLVAAVGPRSPVLRRPLRPSQSSNDDMRSVIRFLVLVGCVGGAAALLKIFSDKSLVTSGLIVARLVREEGGGMTLSSLIEVLFSHCLLIAVGILMARSSKLTAGQAQLSLCALLFLTLLQIAMGGRTGATFLLGYLGAIAAVRTSQGQRAFPQMPRVTKHQFVVTTAMLVIFFGYVFVKREEYRDRVRSETFSNIESQMYVEVEDKVFQGDVGAAGVLFLAYTTHAWNQLDELLHDPVCPGPYYGAVTFSLAWVALEKFGLHVDTINEVKHEIVASGKYYGLFGSLYLDYGYSGAVIVWFLFGTMTALVWRRAVATGTIASTLIAAYFVLTLTFASIMPVTGAANGMSILLAILLGSGYHSITRRTRKRNAVASREVPNPTQIQIAT